MGSCVNKRSNQIVLLVSGVFIAYTVYFTFALWKVNDPFIRGNSSREWLCLLVSVLCIIGICKYKFLAKVFADYFTAKDHALNIAIFRIVICYMVLTSGYGRSVLYSGFPHGLLEPAPGWDNIIGLIPYSPALVQNAVLILKISCFFALIGLCTRFSLIITMVLYLYVVTITQMFGKVNHFHHIFWCLFVLSFSRCYDALSVDVMIRAWKEGWHNYNERIKPSIDYALPLRFIWILIALVYFFPGIWKAWSGGIDWVFSDNMRNMMYRKWLEFDNWTPVLRIDQYPFICYFMALSAMVWEITFIIFIFFRRLRYIPVILGLFFHNLVNVFMRINFISLLKCYVAFFNWHAIFRYIGRKFYSQKMYVIYDGKCGLCCRAIGVLRSLDILQAIDWVSLHDKKMMSDADLKHLNHEKCLLNMHAVSGGRTRQGYYAYRMLLERMPILWGLLLLMYVPPVAWVGKIIYGKVARKQRCELMFTKDIQDKPSPFKKIKRIAFIIVMTTFVGINIYCGMLHIHSWPFAAYPTFRNARLSPLLTVLEMRLMDENGQRIDGDWFSFTKEFGTSRVMGNLVGAVRLPQERQEEKILSLFEIWYKKDKSINQTQYIDVYKVRNSIVPEQRVNNPVEEKFLFRINLDKDNLNR